MTSITGILFFFVFSVSPSVVYQRPLRLPFVSLFLPLVSFNFFLKKSETIIRESPGFLFSLNAGKALPFSVETSLSVLGLLLSALLGKTRRSFFFLRVSLRASSPNSFLPSVFSFVVGVVALAFSILLSSVSLDFLLSFRLFLLPRHLRSSAESSFLFSSPVVSILVLLLFSVSSFPRLLFPVGLRENGCP